MGAGRPLRGFAAFVLIVALAGLLTAPALAKPKPRPDLVITIVLKPPANAVTGACPSSGNAGPAGFSAAVSP